MNTFKILVVDDEQGMRSLIRSFLTAEGYEVHEASNGMDALRLLDKISVDLTIIDIMMPFMDGYELLGEIRKSFELPVIVLSAKGEEWDKVKGLKLGADDYVSKPFYSDELIARVETVLRRSNPHFKQSSWLKAGPFSLDQKNHCAYLENKEVPLTLKEFQLLAILMVHKGNVMTRRDLLEKVWGIDYAGTERTVDTHIKTLRIKLGELGSAIKTIWGVGYKLEV